MIRAVVFDVGETLLDDTREFGAWADWIGVPRHTFSAVLGAVTAQGRNNAETFQWSPLAKKTSARTYAAAAIVGSSPDASAHGRPGVP